MARPAFWRTPSILSSASTTGLTGCPAKRVRRCSLQPLRPGQRLSLRLEQLGAQDVTFSYVAGDSVHSSGRLRFNLPTA